MPPSDGWWKCRPSNFNLWLWLHSEEFFSIRTLSRHWHFQGMDSHCTMWLQVFDVHTCTCSVHHLHYNEDFLRKSVEPPDVNICHRCIKTAVFWHQTPKMSCPNKAFVTICFLPVYWSPVKCPLLICTFSVFKQTLTVCSTLRWHLLVFPCTQYRLVKCLGGNQLLISDGRHSVM